MFINKKSFIITLFLILLIGFVNASGWNSTLSNGLRGYWTFNESGGTDIKSSVSSEDKFYNMTIYPWNATSSGYNFTSGLYGNALNLSLAKANISARILNNFSSSEGFTFSTWWNYYDEGYFLDGTANNPNMGSFLTYISTGSRYVTYFMENITPWEVSVAKGTGGVWNHVVLIWNGTELYGYTNNVKSNTIKTNNATAYQEWANSTHGLTLARAWDDTAQSTIFFDEMSIWNRTLTEGEITRLYNKGVGVTYNSILAEVNITKPANNSKFNYNSSISVNYTVIDEQLGSNCWWSINDRVTNNSLLCGQNLSLNLSEGETKIFIYANSTDNNIGLNMINVSVDSIIPSINITNPNITFSAFSPININISLNDNNPGSCVYNVSESGINSLSNINLNLVNAVNISNFSLINDGNYIFNISCNDTHSNYNSSIKSFTIDTLKPNLTIISPINSTTYSLEATTITLSLNYTIRDINLGSCYYNVTCLSAGCSNISHTQVLNCVNTTLIVNIPATGTYNFKLNFEVNDSANNKNSSSIYFFTENAESPGTPGAPGAGGGASPIMVISGNLSWNMYTDKGADKYEIIMNEKNNKQSRDILFTNNADTEVKLKLECEDVDSNICQYVVLDKYDLTLPPSTTVENKITFTINIVDDIEDGEYNFNILSTDQNDGAGRLSVKVLFGKINILITILSKITGKREINLERFGIPKFNLYNLVIILFISGIIFTSTYLLFLKKVEVNVRFPMSFLASFISAIVILFVI